MITIPLLICDPLKTAIILFSHLDWSLTVGVSVAYTSKTNSGFTWDVPNDSWDKQYSGEKISSYETVVIGSHEECTDVPQYKTEYYTEVRDPHSRPHPHALTPTHTP